MATLYLCKMNPDTGKFIAIIGCVVEYQDGYRFMPKISGRKPSRKVWLHPDACIPRWAKMMGTTRLMQKDEWISPYVPGVTWPTEYCNEVWAAAWADCKKE